jgi:hypothetical protein
MSDNIPSPAGQSPEAVWLLYEMNGGIISTPELAVKVGEALCETHYGPQELERQKPLSAVDKGNYWRVEGSWNRGGKIDGPGAFFLSIQKRDGLITDLGQWRSVQRGPLPGSKKWWAQFGSKDSKGSGQSQ